MLVQVSVKKAYLLNQSFSIVDLSDLLTRREFDQFLEVQSLLPSSKFRSVVVYSYRE